MDNYIQSLEWRYATKKYDSSRKVSAEDLQTLKDAVRLSVSSMGLQPYKVVIVENTQVREQLKAAAFNQSGIVDASHLFVFANEANVGVRHVEDYIENIARVREVSAESLSPFADKIKEFLMSQTDESRMFWTSKQAYIAMSSLINAAAVLKIDATPMEGFDKQEFNRILGLDAMGLNAAVVATVGYRHPDDHFQHNKKVRKPNNELFITI